MPLPNRFGPAVIDIARLRGEGRAGQVAHAHFRIVNGPPERYAHDGVGWVVDPSIGGGGALRNLGIHGVDAALMLASGRAASSNLPRSATASTGRRSRIMRLLILEDEAGAVFTVEAGYTFASMRPGGDFEWRIVSANATLIDRGDKASAHARRRCNYRPAGRAAGHALPALHARHVRTVAAKGVRRQCH